MMPVKKLLEMKVIEPLPPVLVIDEAGMKNWKDVDPYCECLERYRIVENYKPFIPGGINPYNRRKIPGACNLEVLWVHQTLDWKKTNSLKRPTAVPMENLPRSYINSEPKLEDLTFIRLPKHVHQGKV